MAGKKNFQGNSRATVFAEVSSSITTGGSRDYGQFSVGQYSRFTGAILTTGSLTIRVRTGVTSGVYQVSSNFAANSGATVFDALNYGQFVYFDITAAQSTVYA